MSFPAMAWAVRQKLPCTQKMVLVMLADRHNKDTGQCNPSHERMADDCGLTRRSVMDQIVKLSEAGFIRTIHRSKDKLKLPNQYRLMLDFGMQEVVNEVHIDEPGITQQVVNVVPRVVNVVPRVVNVVHQGSEPVAHKPVIEPVNEPKEKIKSAEALECPSYVDKQVWDDFLKIRKAKRSPLTNTALTGIQREADSAGVTLETALKTCCERGWVGFKADWLKQNERLGGQQNNTNKHAGAAAAIFDYEQHSEVIDV